MVYVNGTQKSSEVIEISLGEYAELLTCRSKLEQIRSVVIDEK